MRLIIYISIIFGSCASYAQQYPIIGQYNYNEMIVNPASTGENGALQGLLSWRQQWVGIDGAPTTQNFSIQSPLKKNPNTSLGLLAYSDRIGVSSQNGVFVNYAYSLKIKSDMNLRFGISGGINFGRSTFSELNVNDNFDPNLIENTPIFMTPNFSFGAKYIYKTLSLGLSIPTVLSSEFSSGGYTRIYHDITSYNILSSIKYEHPLSEKFTLSPSLFFKYHAVNKDQLDAMLTLNYMKRYAIGVGYRTYEGMLMHFKVGITDQFSVGAQYEIPMFGRSSYKASSFEILVLYNALYKSKTANPRY